MRPPNGRRTTPVGGGGGGRRGGGLVQLDAAAATLVIVIMAAATMKAVTVGGGLAGASSELVFDNQQLGSIPVEQMCALAAAAVPPPSDHNSGPATVAGSRVNLVSFANNRIRQLEPNTFSCVGSALKILILSYNGIEQIHLVAFSRLEALQVLLLDNNLLRAVPAVDTFKPLKSLRHLNLAYNRIETLESGSFGVHSASLISLNLKGNPLHSVAPNALVHLVKLKTLTMSQSALSGSAAPLAGLPELRFYHLDRAADLSSAPANFCQSSRKLSSLVLKSNQLEQIPQFAHCQSLLLLDLSYNRLAGALSENFTHQPNLIDLYLGHNQLEWIHERAFVGLGRLQVLELDHNQLKHIHPSAFVAVRATIYDLNLSNNHQLAQLSARGLEQLASLKAFGNQQLRELPHFPAAVSLALTYAYHCCDYLEAAAGGSIGHSHSSLSSLQQQHQHQKQSSLFSQLLAAALAKLGRLFGLVDGGEDNHQQQQHLNGTSGRQPVLVASVLPRDTSENLQNLTEMILWPPDRRFHSIDAEEAEEDEDGLPKQRQAASRRSPPANSAAAKLTSANLSAVVVVGSEQQPEVLALDASAPASGRGSDRQQRRRRGNQRRSSGGQWNGRVTAAISNDGGGLGGADQANSAGLIDDLVWQVKQIRMAHSVGGLSPLGQQQQQQQHQPQWQAAPAEAKRQRAAVNQISRRSVDGHWQQRETFHSTISQAEPITKGSDSSRSSSSLMTAPDKLINSRAAAASMTQPAALLDSSMVAESVARRLAADVISQQQRQRGHRRRSRRESAAAADTTPSTTTTTTTVQCAPEPSALLPCRDLFDTWWLRAGIWCVFLLAFTGNILVIVVLSSVRQSSATASALTSIMWLAHSKRHIDVPRFLVINLAIADLLMGLYLGILAFVDLSTLGEFRLYAIKWQYSTGCKLAGFLGVLSSELSVFILAIITLERNYAITNAVHLNRRLSLQKAMVIMFLGYAFALAMALLPLNGISDYRKFSICLPLDMDSNLSSQLYVIALIGINTFSFLLLLSCYLRMYCAIRGSQAWNTNDLRIAKRMSILVLTDFLCWSPIIVVGLGSLFGYHMIGLDGLKILTIFILPLNSVANPFLYAITTKKFKRDLDTLMRRLRALVFSLDCVGCAGPTDGANGAGFGAGPNAGANNNYCKDPRLFVGYNHHQSMLLLNKNTTNNNNTKAANKKRRQQMLAAQKGAAGGSGADLLGRRDAGGASGNRQQQQQQRLNAMRRYNNNNNNRTATNYPTANQVTMNRTTCSCQRINQEQEQLTPQSNNSYKLTRAAVVASPLAAAPPPLPLAHLQPRIVLDSAESGEFLKLDQRLELLGVQGDGSARVRGTLAPGGLLGRKSRSTNAGLTMVGTATAAAPDDHHSPLDSVGANGGGSGSGSSFSRHIVVLPLEGGRAGATSASSSVALRVLATYSGQQQQQQQQEANRSSSSSLLLLRGPKSAEVAPEVADEGSSTFAPHLSCHTFFVEEPTVTTAAAAARQQLLLNPINVVRHHCHEHDYEHNQAANRSVSACGYPPSATTATTTGCEVVGGGLANRSCRHQNIGHEGARVCGSCDTMRTRANNKSRLSAEKLSRSINRLLFSPVAKAWSSIQISLSSSLNQAVGQSSTICPAQERPPTQETPSSAALADGDYDYSDDDDEDMDADYDQLTNKSTFDDIISSPSIRLMKRMNERRMSRSCDAISLHHNKDNPAKSPTSSGAFEASSSQTDHYDDDQRILLATMHRLKVGTVAGGRGQRRQQRPNEQLMGLAGRHYARNRCTRCRSWSPALLTKLEDCIYQIKSKIPRLSTVRGSEQAQEAFEQSSSTSDVDNGDGGDESHQQLQRRFGPSSQEGGEKMEDGENDYRNRTEDDDDDDVGRGGGEQLEDKFNESEPLDWERSQNRGGGRGRPPRGRHHLSRRKFGKLKQQSSTNSDTLSTRTAGTIVTNMSVSFDSNDTNIPVPPGCSSSFSSSASPSQRSSTDATSAGGVGRLDEENDRR